MNDTVYTTGDPPFIRMITSLFMPVPSTTASTENVINPEPTQVIIEECFDEPEDLILSASPVIQQLIIRAKKEPVSVDWERELDEL